MDKYKSYFCYEYRNNIFIYNAKYAHIRKCLTECVGGFKSYFRTICLFRFSDWWRFLCRIMGNVYIYFYRNGVKHGYLENKLK